MDHMLASLFANPGGCCVDLGFIGLILLGGYLGFKRKLRIYRGIARRPGDRPPYKD